MTWKLLIIVTGIVLLSTGTYAAPEYVQVKKQTTTVLASEDEKQQNLPLQAEDEQPSIATSKPVKLSPLVPDSIEKDVSYIETKAFEKAAQIRADVRRKPKTVKSHVDPKKKTKIKSNKNTWTNTLVQKEVAKRTKAPHQITPGYVKTEWNPALTIHAREGRTVTASLPRHIKIKDLHDASEAVKTKQISDHEFQIIVRAAGVDTNLIIQTDQGSYPINVITYKVNKMSFYPDTYVEILFEDVSDYATAPRAEPARSSNSVKRHPLHDYLDTAGADPTDVRVPHKVFEKNDGDSFIAPCRVFEDQHFTYFDFGDCAQKDVQAHSRPRPVISRLVNGVERPVNYTTLEGTQIVRADHIGSFALSYGASKICVIRTDRDRMWGEIVLARDYSGVKAKKSSDHVRRGPIRND